jgi:hypothetical protein
VVWHYFMTLSFPLFFNINFNTLDRYVVVLYLMHLLQATFALSWNLYFLSHCWAKLIFSIKSKHVVHLGALARVVCLHVCILMWHFMLCFDSIMKLDMFTQLHVYILSYSGTFKLSLQFSEDYPNKPPTVRFVSRMFHPNSKLLGGKYKPSYPLVRCLPTNVIAALNSLCRWKYLSGYIAKSVESYIWCCCDSHFYPGII